MWAASVTALMFGLLRSLFAGGADSRTWEERSELTEAIESVIAGTDPRLHLVSGYARKLRDPVGHALQYIDALAARIPGPIAVSRKAFSADPQVHAFFGSADQLQDAFSLSRTIRDFLARPENRALAEIHAVLGMDKEEKTVLGAELDGDMLRRDVKQRVVNFTAHRLIAPAASEANTRRNLRERGLNHLIACALEVISSFSSRRQELDAQRILLKSKLRALRAKHQGLEGLLDTPGDFHEMVQLQRELAATEQKLKDSAADWKTLDDYLAQIREVFSHPEDYLRLTKRQVRLNWMGIEMAPEAPGIANEIVFAEVELGDERRAVGVAVTYPRDEILPPEHYAGRVHV